MTDFLLELRSEEIPARMQDKAREDLARLFAEALAKAGLAAPAIETFATPRRLALIARDLPLSTEASCEETKGPRASAPPQALEGFLRKTGLARGDLIERDGVLFALVEKPGRATAEVLADAIPAIVRAFPWPKSMRWGAASAETTSLRWVRPLQGIVALLGEMVVPFAIDGIVSGAATLGHRFHHPGPITIGSAADYAVKLRAAHVIVDQAERRAIVAEGAAAAAAAEGLSLVLDEGLVAENAGLTEWPVPLLGRFDPAFLDVPREVIQLTMRTNQKYFACVDGEGRLAPAFVCTANIAASDGGAAIVAGNRKVLAARLSDARFFWEQDLKVPLAEQAKKLDRIVFHEKLGTVADRIKIQTFFADSVSDQMLDYSTGLFIDKAIELAKADLTTAMVGEFPELQGIIGGYYAAAQGYNSEIAIAISEQYKPNGASDVIPTSSLGQALSLVLKLDTLVSFFIIGERPSGSRDPFALRRACLSAIRIILEGGHRISLRGVIERRAAFEGIAVVSRIKRIQDNVQRRYPQILEEDLLIQSRESDLPGERFPENIELNVVEEVLNFFADRLKIQQREAGVRHDLIDAVFALGGEDDLVRLLARVKALQAFVGTEDGANLLAGYKRAANILKKEGWEPAPSPLLGEGFAVAPAEAALAAALDGAEAQADAAVAAEDFERAMAALATLRAPIDAFFEQVTVNDPEPAIRARRLALLARVREAVHRVADFSKIEG